MTSAPVRPVLVGAQPDPDELYANFRPIRYRYVMAYLHDTPENITDNDGNIISQVLHKAGEVYGYLPMTAVTYSVGFYSGTQLGGNIYLPDFFLNQMPHPPSSQFDHEIHPYQVGTPIGSMFEVGNRAIYVMRNDEVVWGGILWTREYSSGNTTMAITATSFDAYIYYRLMRESVMFNAPINIYRIWYAVLAQALTDFTWPGVAYTKSGKTYYRDSGLSGNDADRHKHGDAEQDQRVHWTGLTRSWKNSKGKVVKHSNAKARDFVEAWPNNSPHIELPPNDLKWYKNKVEVTGTKTFHGYDMAKFGEALQQWADTDTLLTPQGPGLVSRFEYRVVCWFDQSQQIFRQRYVFGQMSPAKGSTPDEPTVDGIVSPLMGNISRSEAEDPTQAIIFDFPGHISEWSLAETMEDAVTRVIAVSGESDAFKHAYYAVQDDLLKVPSTVPKGTDPADPDVGIGTQGWLLYDQTVTTNTTSKQKVLPRLQAIAAKFLRIAHVPQAVRLNDLNGANPRKNAHTSDRATTLTVALYQDPGTVFPEWTLGDWVTFAIEDPFYGGKMYVIRRIIGYTVTVLPDQESDYSNERIELTLTDDTKVSVE